MDASSIMEDALILQHINFVLDHQHQLEQAYKALSRVSDILVNNLLCLGTRHNLCNDDKEKLRKLCRQLMRAVHKTPFKSCTLFEVFGILKNIQEDFAHIFTDRVKYAYKN